MIYKVFYQETKERNPRRETTHTLYLDIDAKNELEGRITKCFNFKKKLAESLQQWAFCFVLKS